MFLTPFSLRAKFAKEAVEVSPGPKMDPHWVPIWEQNAVQKVVAQLPVGSPGVARAPQAFQHAQGLIFIAFGVRFAGLGPRFCCEIQSIPGADGCPLRIFLQTIYSDGHGPEFCGIGGFWTSMLFGHF